MEEKIKYQHSHVDHDKYDDRRRGTNRSRTPPKIRFIPSGREGAIISKEKKEKKVYSRVLPFEEPSSRLE